MPVGSTRSKSGSLSSPARWSAAASSNHVMSSSNDCCASLRPIIKMRALFNGHTPETRWPPDKSSHFPNATLVCRFDTPLPVFSLTIIDVAQRDNDPLADIFLPWLHTEHQARLKHH